MGTEELKIQYKRNDDRYELEIKGKSEGNLKLSKMEILDKNIKIVGEIYFNLIEQKAKLTSRKDGSTSSREEDE